MSALRTKLLQDVFAAVPKEIVKLKVGDETVEIEVRGMRGIDTDELAKYSDANKDARENPVLAVLSCYDPATGERVFTMDDVKAISEGYQGPLLAIRRAINKVNSWGVDLGNDG